MPHVLLAQAAATLALAGLIWTVQVVHYPLFARVGDASFPAYHAAHARRITWLVAPLMSVELVTAAWLALVPVRGVALAAAWGGLLLVLVVWLSTALLQVPRHAALGAGFDARSHTFLVRSNWVRTLAWTARAALCVWMLGEAGA